MNKPIAIWRVFVVVLFFLPLFAQAKKVPPKSDKLVTDYVHVMTEGQKRQLEQKLVAFNDTSSTQIAVVIEASTEGDDIFDYAFRLAEKWEIGQKEKDNGVLIYVAVNDRKIRIITGYGVEATLTDLRSKHIIEDILKPAFRKGQYYVGLNKGTNEIIKITSGEFTAEPEPERHGVSPWILFALIMLLFFLFAYLASRGKGGPGGGYYRGGHYDDPWRGSKRGWIIGGGGFSGGSFGGGGGGGFDGGGFGGFGGGGFGGGGAGGSW